MIFDNFLTHENIIRKEDHQMHTSSDVIYKYAINYDIRQFLTHENIMRKEDHQMHTSVVM